MPEATSQKSLSIGVFELYRLQGGLFHLDDGTMFGQVSGL